MKSGNKELLFEKYPNFLEFWDRDKNSGLNPYEMLPKSEKEVWWKCKNGHEWLQEISNRTENYPNIKATCSDCRSIAFYRPDLMKEWNTKKNTTLDPSTITLNSEKKVWWKCSKGHEWQTTVYTRTRTDYPDPEGKTKGHCKHPDCN